MRIHLLGPLGFTTKQGYKTVSSAQVRTILALLVLSAGRPVSVNLLIDELWPEATLRNAKNALQAALTRLRRVLVAVDTDGTVSVRTLPSGYVLEVDRGSIDVCGFEDLLERATLAGSDWATAAGHLASALALWRGPCLVDVAGGALLQAERVHLEERRLEAMENLADLRLRLGDSRPVVGELKRLVEIHPERERFSELLMLALYRGGQQTEALAVFGRVRARLRAELGLEPGRRLCQLQQAILLQDALLDADGCLPASV